MALDKEILDGFREESTELLEELEDLLSKLDQPSKEFPSQTLSDFSQRIDRIMGGAQTMLMMDEGHMGLMRIGGIASLCKKLGYKAAELKDTRLIPIFSGFLADTVEVLDGLVQAIDDEDESERLAKAFASIVESRLHWLSEKINERKPDQATSTNLEIDELLKSLG
jgi:chemotaxis protein histidine kinase CheA